MQDTSISFFKHSPLPHIALDNTGKIIMANSACEWLFGDTKGQPQRLIEYIHEKDRNRFLAWLSARGDALLPLIVHMRFSMDTEVRMQLHGRKMPDATIISFVHPTEQSGKSTTSRLNTSELQKLQISDALYASLLAITNTLDLEEVLDQILENVSRAIPYDAADIMLINDHTAYVAGSRGYEQYDLQEIVTSLRFPLNSTPTMDYMFKTRSPLIIDNMQEYAGWVEYPQQSWMKSYVGVPIEIRDTVIGFLNLVSSEVAKYNETHLEWLNAFGLQAAVAINNARAYEKANELAVAEERQRMAREIHDTVSQMLFSSSMMAESLSADERITDASLLQQLQHIFRLNRGALAEMRLLLMEYKPENLLQSELPILLQRLKEAVEGRTQITIDLQIDDGHPAKPEVRYEFYRIAQEALNNISKHARAEHAYIKFESTTTHVTMEIADKGIGFDTSTTSFGDGLSNMYVRAYSIGATLIIDSAPTQGTTVKIQYQRDAET